MSDIFDCPYCGGTVTWEECFNCEAIQKMTMKQLALNVVEMVGFGFVKIVEERQTRDFDEIGDT